MATRGPEASAALFSGAHHQSFQGTDFRTAGNDMYMPTINVSFNARTLAVAANPTDSDLTPDRSTPRQRRSRFLHQAFRLFRSPEFRDVLMHQPAAPPAIIEQPIPTSPSQQASTSATVTAGQVGGEFEQPREEDDFIVTTLGGLDFQSTQGQEITNAEVYVRGMLRCRKGLACWHPRPRQPFSGQRGVVPGDVGIFDLTDGFKRIFNIWEDDGFFQRLVVPGVEAEELPPKDTTFHLDELIGGHTIVNGGSSMVNESQDGRYLTSFEFHCQSEQGAILACTAAADLEELVDPTPLRHFLVKHAGVVYQHANSIRRIADEDSLYIVSGCIKTDSWALAAWQDAMHSPHDLMKLVRKRTRNDEAQVPSYIWTHRGTAEAQSGSTSVAATAERRQRKDQCLFLRGFKLSLSKDFRSRLNDPSFNHNSESKDDVHGSRFSDKSNDAVNRQSRSGNGKSEGNGGRGNPSNSSANLSSSGRSYELASGIRIDSFPPFSGTNFHPCDKITDLLLEMTGADCALSHDDDWRLFPNITMWDDDSWIDLFLSKTICVRNGIAYLVSTEEQPPGENHDVVNLCHQEEEQGSSYVSLTPPFPVLSFSTEFEPLLALPLSPLDTLQSMDDSSSCHNSPHSGHSELSPIECDELDYELSEYDPSRSGSSLVTYSNNDYMYPPLSLDNFKLTGSASRDAQPQFHHWSGTVPYDYSRPSFNNDSSPQNRDRYSHSLHQDVSTTVRSPDKAADWQPLPSAPSLVPSVLQSSSPAPGSRFERGVGAKSRAGDFGSTASSWPNPMPRYSESKPSGLNQGTDIKISEALWVQRVSKPNVSTLRVANASHKRQKQEASFTCPFPGCGSAFTRSFNLKAHMRSHNEDKPFVCHWPGCGKGFARQHDCNRHEQLHTNYRPFRCEGCNRQFFRMDALNRHLRSEGGAECAKTSKAEATGMADNTSTPSVAESPPQTLSPGMEYTVLG